MRNVNLSAREKFVKVAVKTGKEVLTLQELRALCDKNGLTFPQWYAKDMNYRAGRGLYRVPTELLSGASTPAPVAETVNLTAQVVKMPSEKISHGNRIANIVTDLETEDLVPKVYKNYVPFGNFDDLVSIVASKKFYPIFVTGHSGNGKTMSAEQA